MPVPVEPNELKRGDFLITFGSQTGQSESIAKQLCERAEAELGLCPRLFCMDQTEKKFWIEKEPLVVIICSSTGDGDPPDNAAKFVRRLCRNTLANDFLKNTTFALLGLGDSNYSTFQGVPNKIDKQLRNLGATELIPTGHADDQVGLDLVVEPWLESLYPALLRYFGLDPSTTSPTQKSTALPPQEMASSDPVAPLTNDLSTSLTVTANDDAADESDGNQDQQEPMLKPAQLQYPNDIPCLIRGSAKLSKDEALRVPVASLAFLATSVNHTKLDTNATRWQNGCKLVGTASPIHMVPVVGAIKLTGSSAKKEKREIQIDISGTGLEYQPGDAFYFIFPNPRHEVNYILDRLRLLVLADNRLDVVVNPNTEKKNSIVPAHIPPVCTLRYLFTYCLDIRRAPGRPLLRVLADYTSDAAEKRRLLELCSSQGVEEFTTFVRQAGLTLADVLHAFPSCLPPIERLAEHLPRLIPRPYSAACAQSRWKNRVRFVYSLVEQPQGEGRSYGRRGLCTEWLSGLKIDDRVPIMLKEPARFRLPKLASSVPMILIGPGAGIAPFIGFLQEIMSEQSRGTGTSTETERWVFFGCRQLDQDFIYRDELEAFERERIITKLFVCESQQSTEKSQVATRHKYVQDSLKAQGKQVVDFLMHTTTDGPLSKVFVCGDAKGMSKGVWETFIDLVKTHTEMSESEAKQFLVKLKEEDRYIEDVWA